MTTLKLSFNICKIGFEILSSQGLLSELSERYKVLSKVFDIKNDSISVRILLSPRYPLFYLPCPEIHTRWQLNWPSTFCGYYKMSTSDLSLNHYMLKESLIRQQVIEHLTICLPDAREDLRLWKSKIKQSRMWLPGVECGGLGRCLKVQTWNSW